MTFMTIHDQVPLAQQPQNDLWMFQIRREHAVLHEKNRNLENTIEHLDLVREEYATKFKALQQQIHTILEKIKDLEANVTQPACKKPLIALEQRVLVLEEERANSLRSPTVGIKGISLGSPRDDFTGVGSVIVPLPITLSQQSELLDSKLAVAIDPRAITTCNDRHEPDRLITTGSTSVTSRLLLAKGTTKRKLSGPNVYPQPSIDTRDYRTPQLFQNGSSFEDWLRIVDSAALAIPHGKDGQFIRAFMEGMDKASDKKRLQNYLQMHHASKLVRKKTRSGRGTKTLEYSLEWSEVRQALVNLKIVQPLGDIKKRDQVQMI